MSLPLLSKCVTCEHFVGFNPVEASDGIADNLPECLAFPVEIPDDVYTWNKPHVEVLPDQEGDYIYIEDPELTAANPGIPDVLDPID